MCGTIVTMEMLLVGMCVTTTTIENPTRCPQEARIATIRAKPLEMISVYPRDVYTHYCNTAHTN